MIEEPINTSIDILTMGEAMGLVVVDDVGPLATADRARLRVGGAELNVAIAASRLGASVAWIGRLGDDGLGDKIERTLRGEGVQVIVQRDSQLSTGLMLKERRTAEHARVTYYRSSSAASRFSHDDVSDELLRQSRVVHVTGITSAISDSARDAVRGVLHRAHQLGVTVSFDVNYRSALWTRDDAREELRMLLPFVDLLFGDLNELSLLDPRIESLETAAEFLRPFDVGHLVLKRGAAGASVVTPWELSHRPAYPASVVDTVGAGDAFVAGYLTAWLSGHSAADSLDRATRVGALACTVLGDWEGAPTLSELSLLDATDPVSR